MNLKEPLKKNTSKPCGSMLGGTAALHLSYSAVGINSSSLGIVPAITFAATANAIRYQGADVRICDVDPKTGLICLDSLKDLIINL